MARTSLAPSIRRALGLVAAGVLVASVALQPAGAAPNDPWKLGGNAGTVPGTDFLGTTDNKALIIKVAGQRIVRFEPGNNVIGGHVSNFVKVGAVSATIAGGGSVASGVCTGANRVTDNFGTIGGGSTNQAGNNDASVSNAFYATVGGGVCNTASGRTSTVGGGNDNIVSGQSATVAGGQKNITHAFWGAIGGGDTNTIPASGDSATIGGGHFNTAGGYIATIAGGQDGSASGGWSAIGGGSQNQATANGATVAGGFGNVASGYTSTIPGGDGNAAAGNWSFAAGHRAKANASGTFVWADAQNADLFSNGMNQFIVRAQGKFFFLNNSTMPTPANATGKYLLTSTGAHLSTGGVWTNASSRASKTSFEPVDPGRILDTVADLPITRWRYREEASGVHHIGPVAEDFHAAFGLGQDTRAIGTVDADGVALVAIQGLNEKVETLEGRLASRAAPPGTSSSSMLLIAVVAAAMALAGGVGLGLGLALGRRQAG